MSADIISPLSIPQPVQQGGTWVTVTIENPFVYLLVNGNSGQNCILDNFSIRLLLTGSELKTLLVERNQPAYGNKTQMLDRLRKFGQDSEQWQSYVFFHFVVGIC